MQLELTAFFQTREQLGIQLATSGDSIVKITKNHYQVKSQSTERWYNVKKLQYAEVWTCECADFMYRLSKNTDKKCKHIIAIQTLQRTYEVESKIEPVQRPKICPKCVSDQIVKNGFRKVKNDARRQRYKCLGCDYKFILGENGFSKVSSDPHIIVETLNLVMGGMSYRNISRHVFSVHQVKISHVSIMNWVRKYTQLIKDYVDELIPEYQEVWSVDEMMLNVKDTELTGKGFYVWMWSIIHPQSRFVIATEISKRREIADARHAFAQGKENANGSLPSYVITDCLNSYKQVFIKEFNDRAIIHIRTKSLSEGFENRPVERYHNELRSMIKARRGLGNDESTQKFVDGYRHYHNFVRPHTGLPNNVTPAEASGIDLKLDKQNPMKDLIVKSATESQKDKNPEMYVINQLGKRFEKLTVTNEMDCIKFKQKAWIEREEWREINDILRVNGFSWLSNGKDSCWIRMQN